MRPSRLNEPWDRSSPRSWALVLAVAAISACIGLFTYATFLKPAVAAGPQYAQGDLQAALGPSRGLRVLFVGNSLTSRNDLAQMVKQLSASNPETQEPLFAVARTVAGGTLGQDLSDPKFVKLVNAAHWDVVVMQEGTGLASGAVGQTTMMSDVRTLGNLARRRGAIPLLFQTWGNRTGRDPGETYETEQSVLTSSYASVATAEHMDVAPVGQAWASALSQQPWLPLWVEDGHHPSVAGSYLAAAVIATCVSYAASHHSFAMNPQRSTYMAGLEPREAEWLAQTAWRTVTDNSCAPISAPPTPPAVRH